MNPTDVFFIFIYIQFPMQSAITLCFKVVLNSKELHSSGQWFHNFTLRNGTQFHSCCAC